MRLAMDFTSESICRRQAVGSGELSRSVHSVRDPPSAILIQGKQYLGPLRTLLQYLQHRADMLVAGLDVGIASMHVQIVLGFVERDGG